MIWLCFSFLIRQLFRRETISPLIHGFLRPCKKHVKSIKIDGILQLENCKGLHDCMYGKTAVRQNKCNFQFLIFDLRTYILTEKICRLIDDVSLSYPFGKKNISHLYPDPCPKGLMAQCLSKISFDISFGICKSIINVKRPFLTVSTK